MTKHHHESLRELLEKNKKWPLEYMFKFIVPNTDSKVDQVVEILPKHGKVTFKHTPNLKYVSVTCVALMEHAESIITVTNNATSIEGVMSL
jgi:hypothetical protein